MNDKPERLLIDTSVLIQAHRTYYAFHLCPGFWDSLIWLHGKGKIISLDKVYQEIVDGKESDVLKEWASAAKCFEPCEDEGTVYWFGQMQIWAQKQEQYSDAAKAEFAKDPDAWIVAYAKAKALTLVTQEVYSADAKKRIPLPNVCKAKEFDVECMNIFSMLQKFGVKFGWKE
jgi:hypothetical protein